MDEARARVELAALFRAAAHENLHEGISNHFSLALSADGQRFLINPYGIHFSQIKASDLLILDAASPPDLHDARIDLTAWSIHGAIHRLRPSARCLVHLHPHYATALAALKSPALPPIDQTTARFFNRIAWDTGFDGMGIGAEGERLAAALGDHRCMMMGNHGLLVAAPTPALAWDLAYHLERACRTAITALSTGQPLAVMSDEVAEKTAQQWEDYDDRTGSQQPHLDAVCALLDKLDDSYRR